MDLHCSLEVDNLISSLSIIDEQIFSRQISTALPSMVGHRLETVLDFLAMLFTSRLSDDHFFFFTLLNTSLVEAFSVIGR